MDSPPPKRSLRKVSKEAAAYASKLKALFDRQATGTRKDLADFSSYQPSVVTRYFKGERVAPQEFVTRLLTFLEERGVTVDPDERSELEELRRAAQETSGAYSAQAAYSRERIAELEREIARLTEQVGQRDRSKAVDEDLEHVAAAVNAEYQQAEPTTNQQSESDETLARVAEELTALRARVEELQSVRTDDILGGLITGRAVDSVISASGHTQSIHREGPSSNSHRGGNVHASDFVRTSSRQFEAASGLLGCLIIVGALLAILLGNVLGGGLAMEVLKSVKAVPGLVYVAYPLGLPVLFCAPVGAGCWLGYLLFIAINAVMVKGFKRQPLVQPTPPVTAARKMAVALSKSRVVAWPCGAMLGGYYFIWAGPAWTLVPSVLIGFTWDVVLRVKSRPGSAQWFHRA